MLMNLVNYMRMLSKDEKGQGMVEYALIIALVAVVLIIGLQQLSGGIEGVFDSITNALGEE